MRVLIAIDRREPQLVSQAAPWLDRWATKADLLYVAPAPPIPPPDVPGEAGVLLQQAWDQMYEEDRAEVAGLLELLSDRVRGVATVRYGSPAAEIVSEAEVYDLVVVGTHGRTGLEALWLGSVAEKVLRTCSKPVFVLRPGELQAAPRVLLALDLDDAPERLIGLAVPYVQRLGGVLDLASADTLPVVLPVLADPGANILLSEHLRREEERREHQLGELVGNLPAAVRGNWRLVIGRRPVPAMLDLAPAYSLLVCGTHGRTGVSRMLMGSVAERLVRGAPGPVLILRP